MLFLKQTETGVLFKIMVLPRSSRNEIAGVQDGILRLKITAPPIEGRANEECLRFLSEALGIKKARITIVGGHKARRKTVSIEGLNGTDLMALIPSG